MWSDKQLREFMDDPDKTNKQKIEMLKKQRPEILLEHREEIKRKFKRKFKAGCSSGIEFEALRDAGMK